MSKVILANAFSLQMLNLAVANNIHVVPVTGEEVAVSGFVSVVGHTDTAAVLTNMLGTEVACNRASVKLEQGDVLFVAQVTGGRLPEGAVTLPEGFAITFVKVTL